MFLPSSSSLIIISCCYIVMICFLKSSCAYAIDSNDLSNSLIDQQFGLNLPSYFYDRNIRTTKFPRIGRLVDDSEEISSLLDVSEENNSAENNNNNNDHHELRLIEQRSVLFPRIGKRAFHNLLWANSRSNPHRMLDGQGRYYINGYNYNIHPIPPKSMSRYRVKRNLLM